ncbi:hypothetical protein [Mariniphaga sediminis]
MDSQEEYISICEYFEAGCSEIAQEFDIDLKIIITYLSRWLNTRNSTNNH